MAKNCGLIILSLFTCLFTLAALGLNLYHFAGHAYYEDKTTGTVLRETSSETADCPPALAVKIEGKNVITGHDEIYTISCPWNKSTKFLGIISFILCQVFAIIVCCKTKEKGSVGLIGVLSFVVLLLVMITIILMIVDIIKGHKKYSDVETDQSSYQPLTYILNILFAAAGFVFGIICAFLGCKATQSLPRNSGHQPAQNANNSTFVGINKSIGMEQSYQLSANTYGNDNSFAAQGWNNGYYTGNTQNNMMNGQTNRVTRGGNLVYQTNNMQSQEMGYNSNHRGHENLGQNHGGRGEQDFARNVGDEGRRNRVGRRTNPATVQNNHYLNNNYRGNHQVRNYQG